MQYYNLGLEVILFNLTKRNQSATNSHTNLIWSSWDMLIQHFHTIWLCEIKLCIACMHTCLCLSYQVLCVYCVYLLLLDCEEGLCNCCECIGCSGCDQGKWHTYSYFYCISDFNNVHDIFCFQSKVMLCLEFLVVCSHPNTPY